ncbi:Lsr2 family protein [Microbacterium koreense]|uniref:Lsr2 family protein n=1 Tax=Microbacterium koreense TaxID=323761 RepID=A0ABW2ZQM1_9MICO
MARRIVHQLIDDLDGTVLDVGEGETVLFSLDGVAYEIDLTDANAARLRDALAPFVTAGRSISSPRATGASSRSRGGSGKKDLTAIREWATQNGYNVSDRGRVAASIVEAYEAAH